MYYEERKKYLQKHNQEIVLERKIEELEKFIRTYYHSHESKRSLSNDDFYQGILRSIGLLPKKEPLPLEKKSSEQEKMIGFKDGVKFT